MYKSTFFDDEEERLFKKFYRDVSWRLIEEYIAKKKRVLEISDKEGFWFLDLAKLGHQITLIVKSKSNYRKATRLLNQEDLDGKVKIFNISFKQIKKIKEEVKRGFDVIIADGDAISTYSDYSSLLLDLFSLLKKKGIIIACFENRYYDIKKYIPDMNLDQLREFLKTGNAYYIGKENKFKFLYHAFTPEEVYDFFEKSGFKVIKIAGKIVLPWRLIKDYLKNPDYYDKLVDIEFELNEIPYLFGSAKQLLFVAQKVKEIKESKKDKKRKKL